MKTKTPTPNESITDALLENIKEQDKANSKENAPDPTVGSTPLPQPDLYQDPGSGYNKDFTFPQD